MCVMYYNTIMYVQEVMCSFDSHFRFLDLKLGRKGSMLLRITPFQKCPF